MAVNIFERYGIKEVANVYFQALSHEGRLVKAEEKDDNGNVTVPAVYEINEGDIVLYLDTLKVSTVETTAENVSAQGGWGNPKLVTWDYGKEITVTLEDAVISWEEMRILLGGEAFSEEDAKNEENKHVIVIHKNAEKKFLKTDTIAFPVGDGTTIKGKNNFPKDEPEDYQWIDMTHGRRGTKADLKQLSTASETTRIRFFWEERVDDEKTAQAAQEIVISPERFPGTYRVVGDALIRSEKDGSDQAFQFVINKAKLLSNVTLTMQAEGDPSTFEMSLDVLRDEDGNMMSLIKY